MREVKTIAADDARRGIAAVRAAAERQGASIVVAIADAYGELLALLRMDGAGPGDIAPAIAKAYTAARLAQPTRAIEAASRSPKTGFDLAGFADPRITGLIGGIPLEFRGRDGRRHRRQRRRTGHRRGAGRGGRRRHARTLPAGGGRGRHTVERVFFF